MYLEFGGGGEDEAVREMVKNRSWTVEVISKMDLRDSLRLAV
jgi:hypothetical protein